MQVVPESRQSPAVAGLVVEAVEWLPSGTDAGLVRVCGRWADPADRPAELPALCVRAGAEVRRFGSLPDVRFRRDPAVWRGSYLVPAVLVEQGHDALWLEWADGREAALPAPGRDGAAPPPSPPPPEPPGGEVIERAVLAERRARRAEEAERAQARRAAEALQAVQALELRSAELERRLEVAPAAPESTQTAPTAAPDGPARASAPAGDESAAPPEATPAALTAAPDGPERGAVAPEATQAALTAALASLARLRTAAHDLRLRLRSSELQRSADAVALASLRDDLGDVAALRAAVAEREVALKAANARAGAAEAEVRATREQAAEQVAAAGRRAAADAAAVRARAAGEVRAAEEAAAAARADALAAQADLDAATQALAGEQAAHNATRNRLEAREAELVAARNQADDRAAALERRLAELADALAGERDRGRAAATELATARAALTAANAERRAESVARAALEEQLDRERSAAGARAGAELAAERAARADAERTLATIRAELAAEHASLGDAERALETLRAQLAAEHAARAGADRAIAHALEAAGSEPATDPEPEALHARIAAIERAASSADLDRHAAEQAAAAAAARRASATPDLAADLDAAAAALRARSEPVAEAAAAPPPDTALRPAPTAAGPGLRDLAASSASQPVPGTPSTTDSHDWARRAAGSARALTGRAGLLASTPTADPASRPWLRSALARLAHDEPDTAARLLIALAPALRAVTTAPLDFDLTIRGSGTYAITLAASTADVRPLGRPRGRHEAAFHATASAATLAEVVAGVRKRIGRWQGSVRVSGRRGDAVALAEAIRGARLSLASVAGAGADLPPDLVFAAFPYAIHPAWTRGHRFTVAQVITDLPGAPFVIAARDGEPVTVSRTQPPGGAEATVSMTRATFTALLGGTPASGERRPVVRGNRAAVAALKAWTDRAQGIVR